MEGWMDEGGRGGWRGGGWVGGVGGGGGGAGGQRGPARAQGFRRARGGEIFPRPRRRTEARPPPRDYPLTSYRALHLGIYLKDENNVS